MAVLGIGYGIWHKPLSQPQIERKPPIYSIISGTVLGVIVSPLSQYQTELWEVVQELDYDYDILYDLWKCEDSELRHDGVFGDSGLAYGGFQWHDKSWYYYNQKFGLKLNRLLFEDQAQLTIMVLKEPDGWRNWYNCLKGR